MSLRNSAAAYGAVAKLLHWIIALAILAMLTVGVIIAWNLPPSPKIAQVIAIHKSMGLTILLFMIVRLIWRLANPTPKMPSVIPLWQQRLIKLIYSLLYFCVFATIIMGWSMSAFGGHTTRFWGLFNVTLPWPTNRSWGGITSDLHEFFGWAIATLICLHAGIFIWHHFVKGNKLLKRMWPRKAH